VGEVRPLPQVPGWMWDRGGQPEAYCHRAMLHAIGCLVNLHNLSKYWLKHLKVDGKAHGVFDMNTNGDLSPAP
jgi:hypothetical protein